MAETTPGFPPAQASHSSEQMPPVPSPAESNKTVVPAIAAPAVASLFAMRPGSATKSNVRPAHFSTDFGLKPKRQVLPPFERVIVRSDTVQGVVHFARYWKQRHGYYYHCFFPDCGWTIEDLWDNYDIHIESPSFLNKVLNFITHDNKHQALQYAQQWSQEHKDRLHVVGGRMDGLYDPNNPAAIVEKIFVDGEHKLFPPVFLWNVANIMRASMYTITKNIQKEAATATASVEVAKHADSATAGEIGLKDDGTVDTKGPTTTEGKELVPERIPNGGPHIDAPVELRLPSEAVPQLPLPPPTAPSHSPAYPPVQRPQHAYPIPSQGHNMMAASPLLSPHMHPAPIRQYRNRFSRLPSGSSNQPHGLQHQRLSSGGGWAENIPYGQQSRLPSGGSSVMQSPAMPHAHVAHLATHHMGLNSANSLFPMFPNQPSFSHSTRPSQMTYGPGMPPYIIHPPPQPYAPHVDLGQPVLPLGPPGPRNASMPMEAMPNSIYMLPGPGFNQIPASNRCPSRAEKSLYNPYGEKRPDFASIPPQFQGRRGGRPPFQNGLPRGERRSSFDPGRGMHTMAPHEHLESAIGSRMSSRQTESRPGASFSNAHSSPLPENPDITGDPERGCGANWIGPKNTTVTDLWIAEVPPSVHEEEVRKFFKTETGIDIESFTTRPDKRNKLNGYVRFRSAEDARQGLQADQRQLHDRIITVKVPRHFYCCKQPQRFLQPEELRNTSCNFQDRPRRMSQSQQVSDPVTLPAYSPQDARSDLQHLSGRGPVVGGSPEIRKHKKQKSPKKQKNELKELPKQTETALVVPQPSSDPARKDLADLKTKDVVPASKDHAEKLQEAKTRSELAKDPSLARVEEKTPVIKGNESTGQQHCKTGPTNISTSVTGNAKLSTPDALSQHVKNEGDCRVPTVESASQLIKGASDSGHNAPVSKCPPSQSGTTVPPAADQGEVPIPKPTVQQGADTTDSKSGTIKPAAGEPCPQATSGTESSAQNWQPAPQNQKTKSPFASEPQPTSKPAIVSVVATASKGKASTPLRRDSAESNMSVGSRKPEFSPHSPSFAFNPEANVFNVRAPSIARGSVEFKGTDTANKRTMTAADIYKKPPVTPAPPSARQENGNSSSVVVDLTQEEISDLPHNPDRTPGLSAPASDHEEEPSPNDLNEASDDDQKHDTSFHSAQESQLEPQDLIHTQNAEEAKVKGFEESSSMTSPNKKEDVSAPPVVKLPASTSIRKEEDAPESPVATTATIVSAGKEENASQSPVKEPPVDERPASASIDNEDVKEPPAIEPRAEAPSDKDVHVAGPPIPTSKDGHEANTTSVVSGKAGAEPITSQTPAPRPSILEKKPGPKHTESLSIFSKTNKAQKKAEQAAKKKERQKAKKGKPGTSPANDREVAPSSTLTSNGQPGAIGHVQISVPTEASQDAASGTAQPAKTTSKSEADKSTASEDRALPLGPEQVNVGSMQPDIAQSKSASKAPIWEARKAFGSATTSSSERSPSPTSKATNAGPPAPTSMQTSKVSKAPQQQSTNVVSARSKVAKPSSEHLAGKTSPAGQPTDSSTEACAGNSIGSGSTMTSENESTDQVSGPGAPTKQERRDSHVIPTVEIQDAAKSEENIESRSRSSSDTLRGSPIVTSPAEEFYTPAQTPSTLQPPSQPATTLTKGQKKRLKKKKQMIAGAAEYSGVATPAENGDEPFGQQLAEISALNAQNTSAVPRQSAIEYYNSRSKMTHRQEGATAASEYKERSYSQKLREQVQEYWDEKRGCLQPVITNVLAQETQKEAGLTDEEKAAKYKSGDFSANAFEGLLDGKPQGIYEKRQQQRMYTGKPPDPPTAGSSPLFKHNDKVSGGS